MSVPPPMDMQMMRGGPPPSGHMWKPEGGGGGGSMNPNGMRGSGGPNGGGAYGMQSMGNTFMGSKPPQFEEEPMGKFSMGSQQTSDDLMWHDPNGELKKWQRDTGVSAWGDPDKAALRPIQNWLVAENDEEDLEAALQRCPVPQKRNEPIPPTAATDENAIQASSSSAPPFNPRLPPIPSGKRQIVVTGWGDLPDNDPNNPNKADVVGDKWGEGGQGDSAWYGGGSFSAEGQAPWSSGDTAVGGAMNLSRMLGGGGNQQNTEAIADQLRLAVEKGYLEMEVLTQQHLPAQVLAQMNNLLAKIPALDQAENNLREFVNSVRPAGVEVDESNPTSWMDEVQSVEYNRLIIDLTTVKIEVMDLSKKMQNTLKVLREEGQLPEAAPVPPAAGESTHDNYQYSFLG